MQISSSSSSGMHITYVAIHLPGCSYACSVCLLPVPQVHQLTLTHLAHPGPAAAGRLRHHGVQQQGGAEHQWRLCQGISLPHVSGPGQQQYHLTSTMLPPAADMEAPAAVTGAGCVWGVASFRQQN
jgi:hypothetical protein